MYTESKVFKFTAEHTLSDFEIEQLISIREALGIAKACFVLRQMHKIGLSKAKEVIEAL